MSGSPIPHASLTARNLRAVPATPKKGAAHLAAFGTLLLAAGGVLGGDPSNVHMDTAYDTGQSTSDGVTYISNPMFRWNAPAGTVIKYQWALTLSNRDPYSLNGIYRLQQGLVTATSATPSSMSDAEYKFWVQAEGPSAGQWGSWVARTFRIDTVDPTAPTNLTNPVNPTSDPAPNVTWTGSTDTGGSGIWTYSVTFVNGGTTYTLASSDATLDDVDFGGTTLATGTWTWQVRAVDVAGNDMLSSTKTLVVDTTGPTNPTSFTALPVANAWTNDNTVDVNWSGASDVGSGLAGYYYRWDTSGSSSVTTSDSYASNTTGSGSRNSGTLADGASWYFHIRYRDQVGNLASSTAHHGPFKIDTTGPPAVPGLGMDPNYDTFGASQSDRITYRGNPRFVWSTPSDGSGSGVVLYQWAVTVPTVTDPNSQARLRDEFTANLYAFTNDDGSLSDLDDGEYRFWVQAKDSAGNWGPWASSYVWFRIDTTKPTAPSTLTNPADPTNDATPNVTWTGSTDTGGSGVWIYEVRFASGATVRDVSTRDANPYLEDGDFTAAGVTLGTGIWTWRVRAIDVAGNTSDDDWTSPTFTTLEVHSGPYTISLLANSTQQTIEGFGGSFAMWGYRPDDALVSNIVADLKVSIVRLHADGAYLDDRGNVVGGYSTGTKAWDHYTEWTGSFHAAKAAARAGVSKFVLSFWYPPNEYLDADRKWKD
jgi:hypothetical protein